MRLFNKRLTSDPLDNLERPDLSVSFWVPVVGLLCALIAVITFFVISVGSNSRQQASERLNECIEATGLSDDEWYANMWADKTIRDVEAFHACEVPDTLKSRSTGKVEHIGWKVTSTRINAWLRDCIDVESCP